MPKMKFNTRIKYKDVVHKGLEPFDVDEADVPELQTRGGVLIVESEQPKPKDEAPKPDDAQEEKPGEVSKPKGKKKAAGES